MAIRRRFVGIYDGSGCGGGQTLERLSAGASPDLFQRVGEATQAFVTAAQHAGAKSMGCHRFLFGQGGSDTGTSCDTYLRQFRQYAEEARQLVMTVTGQKERPFFEWFVISGGNEPMTGQAVARAQVDAFRQNLIPDGYCVGPGYWSPDYYAHWSANGERWFGAMRAKIASRVIYLNQGWKPLHVTSALWRGDEILLNCHVPAGPLQFRKCWVGQHCTWVPDYGFLVRDATGKRLPVEEVQIVADTVLLIRLKTAPDTAPVWSYAETDWSAGLYGSGNVCDSDPAVSFSHYVWVPGMPFTEDDPALTGRPFTLENWLCPYQGTTTAV